MLKYKLRCEKLNFNCRQTKKIVDVGHAWTTDGKRLPAFPADHARRSLAPK